MKNLRIEMKRGPDTGYDDHTDWYVIAEYDQYPDFMLCKSKMDEYWKLGKEFALIVSDKPHKEAYKFEWRDSVRLVVDLGDKEFGYVTTVNTDNWLRGKIKPDTTYYVRAVVYE